MFIELLHYYFMTQSQWVHYFMVPYCNKHMLKTDKMKSPVLCWPLVQFAVFLITLHAL
jgi:hypothetical protein